MRTSMVVLFGLVVGTVLAVFPPIWKPAWLAAGTAAKNTIVFTVWGMPFEDRLFKDGYARGYESVNPGVHVDYQRHSDINMKYNAWHAAGTGPEVMRIMVTDYDQMVARGMLEPLDAYINGPRGLTKEQLDAIPKHMLDALRIDGTLYALPEDNAQFGLYYNKALIDQYNAEHPDAPVPYPDESWDWRMLRASAKKLTKRDANGNVIVHGFDMSIWQWPFMNFFAQAGGRLWSDDGLTTLVNSRAGVKTLEYFRLLAFVDKSWQPYFGRSQGTGPDSRFKSGRTALYMDGSWMIPSFELSAPDLDFAVAPVPHGKLRRVVCGSCLWGISAHAKDKDDGWDMIRWLVSDEQALRYWDTLRVAPPANLNVLNSTRFEETHGIPSSTGEGYEVPPMPRERYKDRAAWLRYGMNPRPDTGQTPGFIPTSLYQRVLEDEIGRMLKEFLRSPDTLDPQTVLDEVARNVHSAIDRDRAARGLPPVKRGSR